MTMDEVGRQYQIPRNILEEYERWGGCHGGRNVMGARPKLESHVEDFAGYKTVFLGSPKMEYGVVVSGLQE